ncbi:GlxA family transcriptional regulator [Neisseria sp.]|uniref:GlxA family transcriptional regulator n=1 Tax=Neisseria sp. TaxID=192066 RepID=UPI0035A0B8C8
MNPPPKIGLLFLPQVKLFHFSVPQMVFGDMLPEKLFDLYILNAEPDRPSEILLPCDGGLELTSQMDILVVAGWHDITEPPSEPLLKALIQAYQNGATLVGLCYGTYALAYSGLLDGRKAATHWAGEDDFVRRFPQVQLDTNALYVDDHRLITSAGTAAGLDCCLYIVRKFYGSRIANKIARLMVVPPHREGGQAQFIDNPVRYSGKDSRLNTLIETVRQNPAADYHIDDLAVQLAMSRRTFTRRFQKTMGISFTQWLISLRLQNSLELLENSALSIEQISVQTGFHNSVSFRQHFKERYQVSPNTWRRTFADRE